VILLYTIKKPADTVHHPGWWALGVTVYAMQGAGRGIFESVNKGLTIDFFPGRAPAAFANVIFQNSLASALAFLIFPSLSTPAATAITGTVCVIAVPSVMYAWQIKKREREGVVESSSVRDSKAYARTGNDFAYA
jgi:hypothetical protein